MSNVVIAPDKFIGLGSQSPDLRRLSLLRDVYAAWRCWPAVAAGTDLCRLGASPALNRPGRSDILVVMSAQPVQEHDPDDPVQILRVLPERFREQFLNEYAAAAEAARRPEGYRALHDLLRLWRLTAAAYSEPGFEARLASVREAVLAGSPEGSMPIEEIVPDWPARLNRQ